MCCPFPPLTDVTHLAKIPLWETVLLFVVKNPLGIYFHVVYITDFRAHVNCYPLCPAQRYSKMLYQPCGGLFSFLRFGLDTCHFHSYSLFLVWFPRPSSVIHNWKISALLLTNVIVGTMTHHPSDVLATNVTWLSLMLSCCSLRSPLPQLSKKYGSVFMVHLGPQKVVVLYGYDVVKEALVDQGDDFSGRGTLPLLKKLFQGTGMFLVMPTCKTDAFRASEQLRGQCRGAW